jgi:hypothetical protein
LCGTKPIQVPSTVARVQFARRSVGWACDLPTRVNSLIGYRCSCFSQIILGFNSVMFLVVDDVPVDSEMPVVTS